MTVGAANRRAARNAPRWIGVNLVWFVGTWLVVGSVYAAAIMLSERDGFAAPASVEAILSMAFTIIVFALMSAFAATVGLMFLGPFVAPGSRSICSHSDGAVARCRSDGAARRHLRCRPFSPRRSS